MAVNLNDQQKANAQAIIKVGRDMGASDDVIQMALAVAWMESRLINNPGGDRDSAGLFQQRPSQGWGTYEQVTNPEYAARQFFQRAIPLAARNGNLGEVAADVQRPAKQYRHLYGDNLRNGTAASIFEQAGGGKGIMGNLAQGAPRAATGAVPAGAPEAKLPPNASQADIEAYVQEHYPGASYLLRADDATRMLVVSAAQNGWSADRLKGEIEKTDWYRKQSESERQWREQVDTDPATAEIRRQQQRALITDQAARLGAVLKPDQLDMIVEGSLRFAWSQQQITDTLAGFTGGKKPVGDSRTVLQNLRATAADFAVPVDKATLQFWTDKILRGEQDEDDFVGYLRGQAIGLFKGNDAAIKQIESGFTVRQIAAGSLGYAGRELDIADTSTLDLMDPKWLRLVHHFDPESKTFRPMSAAEVQRTVRTDPTYGFDKTENAKGLAARLRGGLEELFGVSA